MTFKEYLMIARPKETPAGDFIRDSRRIIDEIPDDFLNVEDLVAFVFRHGGCVEAQDAARDVWRSFRLYRKAHGYART